MQSKKERVIYWLLGVGSGMVLSGMVAIALALGQLKSVDEVVAQRKEIEQFRSATGQTPVLQIEAITTTTAHMNVTESTIDQTWVAINIPPQAGSEEIATLLFEKGIIEDAQAFSQYIKTQKKTKSLQHGTLAFPRKGQYSEVLDILLTIPQ
ncbi:MAG: hypothetical protein ACRCW2_05920 [Cellulosilyticaceae bacterium]